MATSSRTYLTTDWQVWFYTPVAGKFRLDFSMLDGSDVLGDASDTGSMTASTAEITAINIVDGGAVEAGSIGRLNPARATIGIQLQNFTKSMVSEYYSGKRMAITLKNQANLAGSNSIYGYNSVIFNGQISNVQVDLDPINRVAQLTIEAQDYLSAIANTMMSVNKTTTGDRGAALYDTLYNYWISVSQEIPNYAIGLGFTGTTHFGANATEANTFGYFLDDFATAEVRGIVCYPYETSGASAAPAINDIQSYALSWTTGIWPDVTIPLSKVFGVTINNNSADIPTNYNLSSINGETYTYGSSVSSNAYNQINYSVTTDVLNATELRTIATKMQAITPKLAPSEIRVEIARQYQSVTYTNLQPIYDGTKWYPNGWQFPGSRIILDLSDYGFSNTETMFVTGRNIEVTPDNFQITYTVTKGA